MLDDKQESKKKVLWKEDFTILALEELNQTSLYSAESAVFSS